MKLLLTVTAIIFVTLFLAFPVSAGDLYRWVAIAFETDKHDGFFRESGICIDLDNNEKCGTAKHFFHGERFKEGQNTFELNLDYP
jgi:hypothetical protein